jgi:putative spermidine/putrescine transport system permease protein
MTAHHSLKAQLRRADRARRLMAVVLVAPLMLFVAGTFAVPLAGIVWRSVDDREVARVLPDTVAALSNWDGHDLPAEPAYRALLHDLRRAKEEGTIAKAAARLNFDAAGFRSLLFKTAQSLVPDDIASAKDALIAIDPLWANIDRWGTIRHAAGPIGPFYLLASLDMRQQADGEIVRQSPEEAVYVAVFLRTFGISLGVMAFCLVLGFPLSYHLASLPPRLANLLMIFVLVPFWTSLLVRTSAWVVILQSHGMVNDVLMSLHLVSAPTELLYNRFAVYIAMTHVLLPFMVLPLYSVMRGISPSYMRAAASLGARPSRGFLRVYLPLCAPGVASGCLLVFMLAIGYYILPALVGGGADRMVSYFIAYFTNGTANWGMASAMSVILLVVTLLLFSVYARLAGSSGIKLS